MLDYRQTPWVQLTTPASNPSGQPRWTLPSYDPAARQWLISVVAPFQRDGAWAGSVGHDIELSQLFRRLLARSSALASSFSMPLFVVDDNGQVLARPDGISPKGASLPERYRPWLTDPRHRRGETNVHRDRYRQRFEELLAAADQARYRAKSEGRNRVCQTPPPQPPVAVVESDRM